MGSFDSSPRFGIRNDLRQSVIVAKNEMKKFMSSRKFMIFSAIVIGLFLILTIVPPLLGGEFAKTATMIGCTYIMFVSLIVLIASTLFASSTIVSEFEERTALIVFTRPIKKSSIFLGKFFACLAMELFFVVLYYVLSSIVGLAVRGQFVFLGASFATAAMYVFATTGVAMAISTLFKKAGTAAVITFMFIMLIDPAIGSVLSSGTGIDPWFTMGNASNAITNSIQEYIDQMNEIIRQVCKESGIDPRPYLQQVQDAAKSCAVLGGWGVVSTLAAFLLFKRREF